MGHADGVALLSVAGCRPHVGPKPGKRKATDDSLVRFTGPVTPRIVRVESPTSQIAARGSALNQDVNVFEEKRGK